MSPGRPRRPRKQVAPNRRSSAVLILSAFPTRAAAERAARAWVEARVVACATVTYGARAFYRWKGRNHAEPSILLLGKTTRTRSREAMRALRAMHPDEVPEILVLPILGGHAPYLAWLEAEVAR
jgi:periplasmic divalent cation tolerance protein